MKRRTGMAAQDPSETRNRRTGTAAREPLGVRQGSRRASAFLARRSLATHRRAWAAVIVATGAAAALIGAFAFVIGSLLVAAPPVQRYAGADAVVAADQKVSYTAKPWGSEPRTTTAYLPERARLDRSVLAAVAGADGVAKAVADDSVPVSTGDGRPAVGRSWPSAALTRYELAEGRAPRDATEVVLDGSLAAGGPAPGERVVLRADGTARTYTVSGIARTGHGGDAPPAVFFTEPRLTALAGHPGRIDTIGVVAEPGVSPNALRDAIGAVLPERSGVPGSDRGVRVLTGAERGEAEQVDALGGRGDQLALLGSIGGTVLMVALLVIASTLSQAIHQRSGELALLRAVGASPRQLRSAIGREAGRVSAAAALLGGIGAVPLGLAMRSLLTTETLPLPVPWWLPPAAALTGGLLVALLARPVAMLAARSITRLR
ncbi:ABC transporter permease, partial [Streptomyces sp. rh206]